MWKEFDSNEITLKYILNIWISKEDDITTLCVSIIDKFDDQIEKTYDQASDLLNFDQKRDMLQRNLRICFSKYLSRNFDLFPHVLKGLGIIKCKEWGNELKEIMSFRLNDVVNKENYIWFARIVEKFI